MIDTYVYVIIALLPVSACLVVSQTNPYHALVIRGILGAIAAMVYAVLGAADVSLTEALVGTMLSITLYLIAVRSSLILRLGIVKEDNQSESRFQELISHVRRILAKHHLRLELVTYQDNQSLNNALLAKEIHATCIDKGDIYQTTTRVRRIHEIMQPEIDSTQTSLNYLEISEQKKQ